MKIHRTVKWPLSMLAIGVLSACGSLQTAAPPPARTTVAVPAQPVLAPTQTIAREPMERIVASWPERPRLGAMEMLAKYGPPQEVTPQRVVWHNAGAFKRITVIRDAQPHDFPMPHVDFMEHTISLRVPIDKVQDLIAFDGSNTINRTVGELSARCDLEAHNILTLNLAHDIVTGRKTVAQARQAFGEAVQQEIAGRPPAIVQALQFRPDAAPAFSDSSVIPGAPLRAAEAASDTRAMGAAGIRPDAEVLATLIAMDLNEVRAAGDVQKKRLSAPVMEFVRMLHEQHGKHLKDTQELGQKIAVRPVITPKVEQLQEKAAGQLAALLPLEGPQFERAFLAMLVRGHTEGLARIDNELLKTVSHPQVRSHLVNTRSAVASHLERAKQLEAAYNG